MITQFDVERLDVPCRKSTMDCESGKNSVRDTMQTDSSRSYPKTHENEISLLSTLHSPPGAFCKSPFPFLEHPSPYIGRAGVISMEPFSDKQPGT
ncbi:hypothetical protein CEXT_397421 [Caerostris extrusa]|uniref:Uncharacterized protein n=1 Tax=Caerostris extrusa TaxID=172846 RepID=A0AAV4Q525_CAEEX|nr:hypothetical protein CEXT_397421 [Caerostris extrusa]